MSLLEKTYLGFASAHQTQLDGYVDHILDLKNDYTHRIVHHVIQHEAIAHAQTIRGSFCYFVVYIAMKGRNSICYLVFKYM